MLIVLFDDIAVFLEYLICQRYTVENNLSRWTAIQPIQRQGRNKRSFSSSTRPAEIGKVSGEQKWAAGSLTLVLRMLTYPRFTVSGNGIIPILFAHK